MKKLLRLARVCLLLVPILVLLSVCAFHFGEYLRGRKPFNQAVKAVLDDDAVKLELLLKQDPSLVQQVDRWEDDTLLHFACINGGQRNAIRALLKYGADPRRKNRVGKSPLDVAKENNRVSSELVGLLEPIGRN